MYILQTAKILMLYFHLTIVKVIGHQKSTVQVQNTSTGSCGAVVK